MSLQVLAPELRAQIFDLVIHQNEPKPAILIALLPNEKMYQEALDMVADKNIYRANSEKVLLANLDRMSLKGVSTIRRLSIRGGYFTIIPALISHLSFSSLTSLVDLNVYFAAGRGPHSEGYFDEIFKLAKRFDLERLSITNRCSEEQSDYVRSKVKENNEVLGIEAVEGWFDTVPGKFSFDLGRDDIHPRPFYTWAWFNQEGWKLTWESKAGDG